MSRMTAVVTAAASTDPAARIKVSRQGICSTASQKSPGASQGSCLVIPDAARRRRQGSQPYPNDRGAKESVNDGVAPMRPTAIVDSSWMCNYLASILSHRGPG
jgi:hypothetical protein